VFRGFSGFFTVGAVFGVIGPAVCPVFCFFQKRTVCVLLHIRKISETWELK